MEKEGGGYEGIVGGTVKAGSHRTTMSVVMMQTQMMGKLGNGPSLVSGHTMCQRVVHLVACPESLIICYTLCHKGVPHVTVTVYRILFLCPSFGRTFVSVSLSDYYCVLHMCLCHCVVHLVSVIAVDLLTVTVF